MSKTKHGIFSKINVTEIVLDHWKTLRNFGEGQASKVDILTFLILPIFGASLVIKFHGRLNKDLVNTLVTALSVFAALLFNLLMLIYDMVKKGNDGDNKAKLKTQFLREIYSNISFCILTSLLTIVVLLGFFLHQDGKRWGAIITFLSCVLLFNFLLTGLMILKRVHVALRKEAEVKESDNQ